MIRRKKSTIGLILTRVQNAVEESPVQPDDPTCGIKRRRTKGRIILQRGCFLELDPLPQGRMIRCFCLERRTKCRINDQRRCLEFRVYPTASDDPMHDQKRVGLMRCPNDVNNWFETQWLP